MAIRLSTLFLRTLREDPADAEVPSHRLLVRAGYIRRVAPGIYSWLPLGVKMLAAVSRIVREEMERIGSQEVLFPALLPREAYEQSGRWTEYGELLFRLQDRRGNDYLLGPTHEELFTTLVKSEYSSYKDLPLSLFQIQTKYRDEARPRAGILRGREFVMKDSYSFDLDDAGLVAAYAAHRGAYIRIFDRLGLDYRIVSAMSGSMGGSASEEFLAPTETGEDTFVVCGSGDYAANVEAVSVRPPEALDPAAAPPLEVLDTPDTPTIATLVAVVNERFPDTPITAADTLKNVVVKTVAPQVGGTPGEGEPLVVGVPGDREVDMKRLEAQLYPLEVRPFEAEDFARHAELVRGYIGPQALAEAKIRYLVDPRVVTGSQWVTGANEPGKHARFVTSGRDFVPDGTIEAAEIRAGDPCPVDGAPLAIARGIEIGHIFQLGRKFADAFGLDVLGPQGKPVRVTMGSYGIGVSRAVAAIAEQTHDERGLCWPRSVAPADVHIVATGKGEEVYTAAEALLTELEAAGVRVLVDDRRGASPGVKFADAELLGMPTSVVIGKGLAGGTMEIRHRRSGSREDVPVGEVAGRVIEAVRADAA